MTRPHSGPTAGLRGDRRSAAVAGSEQRIDHGATDVPDGSAARLETGTTLVALRAPDEAVETTAGDEAVVLATDRRASLGGRFVSNKDVRKVEAVHPTAAMAISGSVGPAQQLLEALRAEASLYESRRREPMSMTALSQTAGALTRGRPVAPILGGVDDAGAHVYEIDGGGSVVADDYAAGGSGMQVAYGVLEGEYDPDASIEEATATARAAVEAASERDTASGNGVVVATVTAEGVTIEAGDGTAEPATGTTDVGVGDAGGPTDAAGDGGAGR